MDMHCAMPTTVATGTAQTSYTGDPAHLLGLNGDAINQLHGSDNAPSTAGRPRHTDRSSRNLPDFVQFSCNGGFIRTWKEGAS